MICWSLFKLTGSNFRATVYLSVALLGLAALVLLRAANRLRGRTSYSDAFIPLILLTWSQYPNLIWSHQIQMISSTVLACVLLALVVRQDAPFGPRLMLGAGLSVLLLPLCGANGLAMTPGLALWLAYQGFRRWRACASGWTWEGFGLLTFAAATLGLVGFYFVNYERAEDAAAPTTIWNGLVTSLQFGTSMLGGGTVYFWPASGALFLGLMAASGLALVWVCATRPADRPRAIGLMLFLGGLTALALSLGRGREGAGFTARYVTMASPIGCGTYFLWGLVRPPLGRLVQVGLFTAASRLTASECD